MGILQTRFLLNQIKRGGLSSDMSNKDSILFVFFCIGLLSIPLIIFAVLVKVTEKVNQPPLKTTIIFKSPGATQIQTIDKDSNKYYLDLSQEAFDTCVVGKTFTSK